MPALAEEPHVIKCVLQNGVGLHTTEANPDVRDPRWQQKQILEFVEIAVAAERLGFDGVSLVEHHALPVTAPSPHLLLAAAAMRTTRIRLATAATVLPLYRAVLTRDRSSQPRAASLACDPPACHPRFEGLVRRWHGHPGGRGIESAVYPRCGRTTSPH